ncbi:MAG TPA: VOC family protein [Tepidisphaeraceae bacterium]|jgi:catechol 2,3-dioxygenase-like lactoylglutathione lyase family enzyme
MPSIRYILESALYVIDLDRSEQFYCSVLGLRTKMRDERMRALEIAAGQILLLFEIGKSKAGDDTPRGRIPGHDGSGTLHLALAIAESDVEPWRRHLADHKVEIVSEVRPEQGGCSLYFRDPDGHLLELATPGIWNV